MPYIFENPFCVAAICEYAIHFCKSILHCGNLCCHADQHVCVPQDKGQEHLVGKLPKNVGWSLGTELRESHYVLSAKNSTKIQKDMIFHVCLGGPRQPFLACSAVQRLLI